MFSISIRLGRVDCVGHAVRIAIDSDPRATVLSCGGIGACDHVLRSAMLGKFLERRISVAFCPWCGWCILNHPATQSRVYAEGHDTGMQEIMARLLGGLPGESQQRSCTRRGHTTHAVDVWVSVHVKNCTWRILGVVGRRIAHDTSSSANHGQCRDGGFERQRARLQVGSFAFSCSAAERTSASICREAGAVVRCNIKLSKLREMSVTVAANDEREVEVLASGLPLEPGAQLAVDDTFRSAAAVVDGAVANAARRDKERKHSELVEGLRCKLVVVAIETGGRWSVEACNLVENLAWAKSREAPVLQRSAFSAWRRRWTRMMLSVSSPVP